MSPGRRDALATLVALACLIAWDVSGADLWVSRQVASGAGFPWRDAWLTRYLLHDGGRWLSGAVLLALVADACRRHAAGPGRAQRGQALGVVLLGLIVVPTLKRASSTSCPWDLAEFGGHASYIPHWSWGVADGGPGHCFPSGHAVAAFAFLALYFLWRPYRPAWARAWLLGTLVAGAVFGAAQVLRGAHFVSHVLWSAWICWLVAALASTALEVFSRRRLRLQPGRVVADGNRA
jgi:membrane-associated PAP2 superfamily phosphatase